MDKNYSRQCKLVIRKTAGATDVKTDNAADGVRLMSFSTTVNMSQHSGRSFYRPEEIKFKLHVKEALRQVAIHSKPSWSMPMRLLKTAREFVTRANFRLSIGIIDMDDCGGVLFKTAADFGAINDISQVLTSLMEAHTGSGLDCFRALEAMKDRGVSATDALAFVTRQGTSNEGVDDHLANMLTVLSQPS